MNIGLVYPQTEYGNDPIAIRDYAQTAEELGFSHILAYEHVLGTNPDKPEGVIGPYNNNHAFLSPFLLFSFMASVTKNLGFATGIVILPQRQTALVAKQAATLDILCGGRLRVGVGLGWNYVEYECLNEDFSNRGRRVNEQIELMRQLWTQPLIKFKGRWHSIPDAGINPLPVQRPIPIWFGGHADPVLERIGKYGNGWMPGFSRAVDARPSLEKIDNYLESAGRSRADIGIEPRLRYGDGNHQEWLEIIKGWQEAGADYISFNTMDKGFDTPARHLNAIKEFAETIKAI
jgi:probable F420-dependent oxidoreductase